MYIYIYIYIYIYPCTNKKRTGGERKDCFKQLANVGKVYEGGVTGNRNWEALIGLYWGF